MPMTIFCFLFLLFILSSSSSTVSTYDSESSEEDFSLCESYGYKCGNQIYDVYYPFRLNTSPPYCGRPEFELSCKSNKNNSLVIHISKKEYKVNYINHTDHLLSVTDISIVDYSEGQRCESIFMNTSLSLSPFSYSSNDANVMILMNCSSDLLLPYHNLENFTCPGWDPPYKAYYNFSTVVQDGVWNKCGSVVFIPTYQTFVVNWKHSYKEELMGLLLKGFELSWKMDDTLCSKCMDTNGTCYTDENGSLACYCSGGTHGKDGTCVENRKLRDGRTVAVKRLHERNRRLEQFMNEIEILSCLRHQNLVTLYGCTSHHSRELLLVYEYIPNGTLADHLHGPLASKHGLPWPTRMSIIIQTAEALSYLHSTEPPVIHRDIKTNNILLDDNFQVKVADFGISRLFPVNATHVSTGPQGTFGYLDPDYYLRFQLTDKSDVYSFGVVMIELISSKTPVDITRNSDEISLANMAITKIRNCRMEELVDPDLGYKDCLEIRGMIDHVAQLAFRCLLSDAETRPSLREVLAVLKRINGEVDAEGVGCDQVKVESTLLSHVEVFSSDHITGR